MVILLFALLLVVSCGPKTKVPKAGSASPDDLIGMLPVDSQGVFYIDLHKAMATEVASKAIEDASKKEDFQEFLAATGIDLKEDVYAIAIAVAGEIGGDDTEGVGILNLKYNKEQILTIVRAKGDEEGKTLFEQEYNGFMMYKWEEKEDDPFFVFYDNSNIIIGNDTQVKACIDVAQKKKDNLFKNAELVSLLKKTNKDAIFWGAILFPPELMDKAASENPMMSNIKDVKAMALFFDYKNADLLVEIKVISTDATKNKQMADFLTGIKGLGGMVATEKPEIGELINKIEITAGKDFVKIAAVIPEELIKTIVEKEKAKEAKEEDQQ
jgi:hypothetical protein